MKGLVLLGLLTLSVSSFAVGLFTNTVKPGFAHQSQNLSKKIKGLNATENAWQINDYVPFLLGEQVATNQDEFAKAGSKGWFYQTLDVKGGFASITGALEGWKEFVLFRRVDNKDLIGVMTVGCGPACSYDFEFYLGLGKDVQNIDIKDIIPIFDLDEKRMASAEKIRAAYPVDYPDDQQFVYNFPQKGTNMQVDLVLGADEIRIPMALLAWNKQTFYIKSFLGDFAD